MIDKVLINGKVKNIKNSLADLSRLTSKKFEDLGIDELYSIRYQIITIVEALVSLCSHIALEVYNYEPSSYKDCVSYVGEREKIKCMGEVKALIGLRNLIIHRYWTINDEQVYNSVKENFKCVEEFVSRVERYG